MKQFLLLMLAMMVITPLAACSEEASDDQNQTSQVTETQTTTETVIVDETTGDTVVVDETIVADETAAAAADESAAAVTDSAATDTDVVQTTAADSAAANVDLAVTEPYALETGENQTTGAVFLKIENAGGDADRLISAFSPMAAKVELHTQNVDGNTVAMRSVDAIDVQAGETVVLDQTGAHIMLIDLTSQLKPGATFPMTLEFEKSGRQEIVVEVKALTEAAQ